MSSASTRVAMLEYCGEETQALKEVEYSAPISSFHQNQERQSRDSLAPHHAVPPMCRSLASLPASFAQRHGSPCLQDHTRYASTSG